MYSSWSDLSAYVLIANHTVNLALGLNQIRNEVKSCFNINPYWSGIPNVAVFYALGFIVQRFCHGSVYPTPPYFTLDQDLFVLPQLSWRWHKVGTDSVICPGRFQGNLILFSHLNLVVLILLCDPVLPGLSSTTWLYLAACLEWLDWELFTFLM